MKPLALDHVIVGGRDLDLLMSWFATESAITPMPGGPHLGLGTRNALVSLGPDSYLELLAIDPDQTVSTPMTRLLSSLSKPATIGWALHGDTSTRMAAFLRDAGLAVVERAMRRVQPDGRDLSWDLVFIDHSLGSAIPFLIDWGDTPSPALTAPSGASLEKLTLLHPDPAATQTLVDKLGLEAAVQAGERSGLRLRITTPRGRLDIEP